MFGPISVNPGAGDMSKDESVVEKGNGGNIEMSDLDDDGEWNTVSRKWTKQSRRISGSSNSESERVQDQKKARMRATESDSDSLQKVLVISYVQLN